MYVEKKLWTRCILKFHLPNLYFFLPFFKMSNILLSRYDWILALLINVSHIHVTENNQDTNLIGQFFILKSVTENSFSVFWMQAAGGQVCSGLVSPVYAMLCAYLSMILYNFVKHNHSAVLNFFSNVDVAILAWEWHKLIALFSLALFGHFTSCLHIPCTSLFACVFVYLFLIFCTIYIIV